MNRRSFVSILTGMFGAVVAALGFGKKAVPVDFPLPARFRMLAFGEFLEINPFIQVATTEGVDVVPNPEWLSAQYEMGENGFVFMRVEKPCRIVCLQNGQQIEIDEENRVVNCSPIWKSIEENLT